MTLSRKTDLADPANALASYLDDLLHTATDAAQERDEEPERSEPSPPPAIEPPEPAPDPLIRTVETVADVSAPTEVETAPEVRQPEPEAPSPAIREAIAAPVEVNQPATRPDWSDRPFECLIFSVAGLQLAVPLILLGAIHRLEQDVKPMPGSPRWYMGILPERSQNLRVVDTAEWIMAGRVPSGARDNYRFVIRLDNSEWALACDDVAQSFTLDPEEVRWRTSRSKRPWLAGTVISHMCALIDVGTMAELLARAEREHHLSIE